MSEDLSFRLQCAETRLERAITGLEAILAESRRTDNNIADRVMYIEARAAITLDLVRDSAKKGALR